MCPHNLSEQPGIGHSHPHNRLGEVTGMDRQEKKITVPPEAFRLASCYIMLIALRCDRLPGASIRQAVRNGQTATPHNLYYVWTVHPAVVLPARGWRPHPSPSYRLQLTSTCVGRGIPTCTNQPHKTSVSHYDLTASGPSAVRLRPSMTRPCA